MGEIHGMMHVVARNDRHHESGISGTFSRDLVYATASAKEGFNCLLGHKACVEAEEDEEKNQLPLRLRKDYQR